MASLLNEEECEAITSGLQRVEEEWATNTFVILPDDEDIHTANERRLKVCTVLEVVQ